MVKQNSPVLDQKNLVIGTTPTGWGYPVGVLSGFVHRLTQCDTVLPVNQIIKIIIYCCLTVIYRVWHT
jgi:hypothetical protein